MIRGRSLGASLALTLALTLLVGNAAVADHLRAVADLSVREATKAEQGYMLAVRLRDSEGRPVNEATVRFYEVVELFGTRETLLAPAVTDGQGNASIAYLPAQTGSHEVIVRFPGRAHVGATEARASFEAVVAARPYRPEAMPLSEFSAAVPYGVAAVVLMVWALIAYAFLTGIFGVLRTRDHTAKGDMA